MKKTALKLSVLLVVLGTCLSGCNDVKAKKDNGKEVLFTVGETNITADDIFGFEEGSNIDYDFLQTDEGVEAVYGAIYKALAQKNAEITSTMETSVKEKMEAWEDEVQSYASSNGITKRNAKKVKLEELGFDSVEELEAHYMVEEQKEKLNDTFTSSYLQPVSSNDTDTLLQKYVAEAAPMIVRHILIKIGDNSTIYKLAEITEDEVDSTVSVLRRLAFGKNTNTRNTFKQIAYDMSEDANEKGGNLGIVDTYTSFVNEFKLGLYAHLVKEGGDTYDPDHLLIPEKYRSIVETGGIYETINKINIASVASVLDYVREDQAKEEQAAAGHNKISEYDADLFPRNYIYNKYFNTPAIQYLVCDLSTAEAEIEAILNECYPNAENGTIAAKKSAIINGDYYQSLVAAESTLSTVEYFAGSGNDGRICDDKGEVVVLAKSTYGFHFITLTHNSLGEENGWKYFSTEKNVYESTGYYQSSEYDYGYSSSTAARTARKNEVKDRVINFTEGGYASITADEKLFEYEVFNKYLAKNQLQVKDTLLAEVESFINNQKEIKRDAIEDSMDKTWKEYTDYVASIQEHHATRYAN